MNVREATINDKERWDSFIDKENGNFYQYFDWKDIYESAGWQFIPLIVENSTSEIISIFALSKIRKKLYSKLISLPKGNSSSFLFKYNLAVEDKHKAAETVLDYIEKNHSKSVSTFTIHHALPFSSEAGSEYLQTLLRYGFYPRHDPYNQLPCNYILQLRRPFEEFIWMKLWSKKLREQIRKCEKDGVTVILDDNFNYAETLISMVADTWLRNSEKPPAKAELMKRIELFKDKSKLFAALVNGKPVVTALCHYTPATCYLAIIASHTKDNHRINLLMNKTILNHACNAGYNWADFGYTPTLGLAHWKERFKGEKVAIEIYEKRYSIPRKAMEKIPVYARNAWKDKGYLWNNRRKLWDRIIHW